MRPADAIVEDDFEDQPTFGREIGPRFIRMPSAVQQEVTLKAAPAPAPAVEIKAGPEAKPVPVAAAAAAAPAKAASAAAAPAKASPAAAAAAAVPCPTVADAERVLAEKMARLKAEGRYRVFFDMERQAGRFPKAFNHSSVRQQQRDLPDEVPCAHLSRIVLLTRCSAFR